jgi:hypothetical protein
VQTLLSHSFLSNGRYPDELACEVIYSEPKARGREFATGLKDRFE